MRGVLQRKCACGSVRPSGAACESCADEKDGLQRKLAIGSSNDPLELEADQIAAQVLSMPASTEANPVSPMVQRAAPRPAAPSPAAPDSVHRTLSGPGSPLDPALRRDMEARFGHDFSQVRIHQDSGAARSARDIEARAFTADSHIVFGSGEFMPATPAGRSLLAHELTHVIQQGRSACPHAPASSGMARLQRKGKELAPGAPPPSCIRQTGEVPGERFLFEFNSSELKAGEDKRLTCFVHRLPTATSLKAHGFASIDGNADYNLDLSCRRANTAASLITAIRPDLALARPNVMHGATPGSANERRSAVIEVAAAKEAAQSKGTCGPEVKDWFLAQTVKAMGDARVLAIQARLAAADTLARKHGSTAQAAAEGGSAAMALKEELGHQWKGTKLANPRPSTDLAAGTAAGLGFTRALGHHFIDETKIVTAVNAAGKAWKDLVGHGKDYDFKVNVMQDPTTDCCPTGTCHNSVTICAGALAENCYRNDLPGNLFYALIGKFAGFSERTLQLGSQFAQLTSPGSVSWDPPEDTAAIAAGFKLSLPPGEAELCAAAKGLHGQFTRANCSDCRQPTTAEFK